MSSLLNLKELFLPYNYRLKSNLGYTGRQQRTDACR